MAKRETTEGKEALAVSEDPKTISCPGCGVKLDITRVEEGTTIECPRCDTSFTFPLEEKEEAPVKGAELEAIRDLAGKRALLLRAIGKVIVGQHRVIDEMLISIFSRGHCLVVGVPGLAKTLLVKTIAQLLALNFKRIQFTPDMMPSDITGTDIIEEDVSTRKREFKFIKGPIFANILLADEINRTPPKTQAALLEAMQEHRVTARGITYPLEPPFFVLATQNPIEQEGTYPLPEAQLDRFMLNISIDYPDKDEECLIVKRTTSEEEKELSSVLSREDILNIQRIVRNVPVSDHLVNYAVNLTRSTRPQDIDCPDFVKKWVSWGAGPRAAQYLVIGGKARAVTQGRYNVSCDDVRAIAKPVLRHRLVTNFNAEAEGISSDEIIDKLLDIVPEPGEKDYK